MGRSTDSAGEREKELGASIVGKGRHGSDARHEVADGLKKQGAAGPREKGRFTYVQTTVSVNSPQG